MPGGATRVAGIIGDPVSHSRSPAIHNAAFAALGLDWVFVAFRVPEGRAGAALEAARVLDIAGLSVTMPHKTAAAAACDELTSTASALGAVNSVVTRDGVLVGDSTDGAGLIGALHDEGVDPSGARVLVLGAGGAARAIVRALGEAGAHVTVAARRLDAAQSTAALAAGAGAVGFGGLADVVGAHEVLVNATPLGMDGEEPPFPAAAMQACRFVLDTVYHPAETPLLAHARSIGVPAANGLGMLVHQAALAFEMFTARSAPLDVMRAAAT